MQSMVTEYPVQDATTCLKKKTVLTNNRGFGINWPKHSNMLEKKNVN